MNPEARLERLERIAKLFAKAGLRYRRDLNRLDENINVLVDTQIGNEDRLSIIEQGLRDLTGKTELGFSELAQGQTTTAQT